MLSSSYAVVASKAFPSYTPTTMKKIFEMASSTPLILVTCAALSGCDKAIQQTIVARANLTSPTATSMWLSESENCNTERILAHEYRDGLWIFALSSTRGGVGVVTQELALCTIGTDDTSKKIWHSIHGGGVPLLVISCNLHDNSDTDCAVYQEGSFWVETD